MTAMLMTNHFVACAWYALGTIGHDLNQHNWLDAHHMLHFDAFYKYITAYHWSLTHFTPGSMHIQPMNALERLFAVLLLIWGMVVFSSFVSSITSAMTQI